jgi:hypothetical protein
MLSEKNLIEGRPVICENGSEYKISGPKIAVVYADYTTDMPIRAVVSQILKEGIVGIVFSDEQNHTFYRPLIGALAAVGVPCAKVSDDDFSLLLLRMSEAEEEKDESLILEIDKEWQMINIRSNDYGRESRTRDTIRLL